MDCATYFSFLKCNFCHFYFRFLHRWHLDLLLEIIQFVSLPILLIEGFRFLLNVLLDRRKSKQLKDTKEKKTRAKETRPNKLGPLSRQYS